MMGRGIEQGEKEKRGQRVTLTADTQTYWKIKPAKVTGTGF